ncbi:MAG TPA: hypothetical protein VLZ81_16720 [Blastocatellia bacterium]|nr:hypothetical protein [Blastocatellia bacterium]
MNYGSPHSLICSSGPPTDPYGGGWGEKDPHHPHGHPHDQHNPHEPHDPFSPGNEGLPIDIIPHDPFGGFLP